MSQINKNPMTTHTKASSSVANKMVNGNNSNPPSHNNVTNGASMNASNAANCGTSATAAPTCNTDFGDNLNCKSELRLLFFFLFVWFVYLVHFVVELLFFSHSLTVTGIVITLFSFSFFKQFLVCFFYRLGSVRFT